MDTMDKLELIFGEILKRHRLERGFGLRRFAELIDMQPSNLSALEHGRRVAPADVETLRGIADALGLVENSDEWIEFFDAAKRSGELPADVQHLANRPLVPALLRTVDNEQLTDEEIEGLISLVKNRDKRDV